MVGKTSEEERKETAMLIHVYKYGMRLRPYGIGCQPWDGFACVAEGGTVDGCGYYNFIYYVNKLDSETAAHYDLDYLGNMILNAEEW